jgi:zinc/manganese transport system substrate-binding protein
MRFNKQIIFYLSLICFSTSLYAREVSIVTTSPDLASIAKYIGGEHVSVISLVQGSVDLHHFEPRPSMIKTLNKADMVIKVGMGFDVWVDSLISVSKNPKLTSQEKAVLNASLGIAKRDIPKKGAKGHSHKEGNPHYLLNPKNAFVVAKNISQRLIEIDPEHKADYEKNIVIFNNTLRKKMKTWQKQSASLKNKRALSFHKTWTYLYNYLGMHHAGTIEPVPDMHPTPSHLRSVRNQILSGDVDLIIQANYYSTRSAKMLTKKTHVSFVQLPIFAENYFDYFDEVILSLSSIK